MALCRGNIEEAHTAARNAASRQHGKEHSGRMMIGRVPGLAGDFQYAIATCERLADIRAMPQVRRSLVEAHLRRHAILQAGSRMGKPVKQGYARAFPPRQLPGRAARSCTRARS